MKPSLESRALSGSVYGIGEGGEASMILYTKVGNSGLFAMALEEIAIIPNAAEVSCQHSSAGNSLYVNLVGSRNPRRVQKYDS